jgi:hypothetical protein
VRKARGKKLHRVKVLAEYSEWTISVRVIRHRFWGFSALKLVAFLMIFSMSLNAIIGPNQTIAYLNDTEESQENTYVAGALDFALNAPSDFAPGPILPGQSALRIVDFQNNNNIPKYQAYATSFVGTLCDYLDINAGLDSTTSVYSGSLRSFNAGEFTFEAPDVWNFTATLQANAPASVQGTTCNFKFVYFGSQTRNDLPLGQGFSDIEEVSNTITAGIWQKVLINKVYYDPDCAHGGGTGVGETKYEWIELYNPLSGPIDISGWEICDNNACDTIPASASLPGQGFAVVTNAATSTWSYWNIPAGVIKISLNSAIGDGLDNNADMLLLKNSAGDIIDQMNWGAIPNPTSTWANYNPGVWNPGVALALEGHTLARVPTGTDTDTILDWKDLGLPQVTGITPASQNWYCNATYNMHWTATNPNGANNLLSIDIVYIQDTNKNGKIDPTDKTFVEAQNISNTGNYSFKVDFYKGYCFLGYVWVKIIATGPENFMLSSYATGGRYNEPVDEEIFDPTQACSNVEQYCGDSPEVCASMEEFCSEWQAFEAERAAEEATVTNGEDLVGGGLPEIIETLPATTTEEISTTTDETATTTDETATTTKDTTIITEDTSTTTQETVPVEETLIEEPVLESEPIIEEQPPVIEEQPVIEPIEPVVVSEPSAPDQSAPAETAPAEI